VAGPLLSRVTRALLKLLVTSQFLSTLCQPRKFTTLAILHSQATDISCRLSRDQTPQQSLVSTSPNISLQPLKERLIFVCILLLSPQIEIGIKSASNFPFFPLSRPIFPHSPSYPLSRFFRYLSLLSPLPFLFPFAFQPSLLLPEGVGPHSPTPLIQLEGLWERRQLPKRVRANFSKARPPNDLWCILS